MAVTTKLDVLPNTINVDKHLLDDQKTRVIINLHWDIYTVYTYVKLVLMRLILEQNVTDPWEKMSNHIK